MADQLTHLPHILQTSAGPGYWDPMHQSIFELTFTVPTAMQGTWNAEELVILSQQVTQVSGLDALQKVAGVNSQKFYGVDVSFLNPTLESTVADITITFNLNLRNVTDAYVLKLFKDWGRLSYDLATGNRALKADYVCEFMQICEANRDGTVWRKVVFKDVFITNVTNIDTLDYSSSDARQLQVSFRSDYWDETLA